MAPVKTCQDLPNHIYVNSNVSQIALKVKMVCYASNNPPLLEFLLTRIKRRLSLMADYKRLGLHVDSFRTFQSI